LPRPFGCTSRPWLIRQVTVPPSSVVSYSGAKKRRSTNGLVRNTISRDSGV
jgi:hypothetical protein